MRLARVETTPEAMGLAPGVLARFAERVGAFAVVDLETTGLALADGAELLEFGAVLVDPGREELVTLATLLRPSTPLPRAVKRLTGLCDEDVASAPLLAEVRDEIRTALRGRVIVAHNAEFERGFLAGVDASLTDAFFLDTLDLLAVTHPDAPDLRLESFTRMLFGAEERHRALDDALDTARVIARIGAGARGGERRCVVARAALATHAPESPWLALLEEPAGALEPEAEPPPWVEIGESDEAPVPFDEDAIAAALADEARGRRHFPGYRVRREQIELARAFVRNLDREEVLLAEGGTGVGKSLAYLAAVIPFAMERREAGPVVVSTRTKLLQDQLSQRDIAAAARFLGHPELRAAAIKGRGNYACARRLAVTLAEGRDPRIFPTDRLAWAVLEACVATRAHGEVGTLPGALIRRYGPLRDLVRRSVAPRAEQCTREQCARSPDCPLGRRRRALTGAQLIIANHDLLLRWPPDYPAFAHVIVDEAHELASVADEVFAVEVSPEAAIERFDEIFGRPGAPGRPRGASLLPAAERRALEADGRAWRRELHADLAALGRALRDEADEFGEVEVKDPGDSRFSDAAKAAAAAADRLDLVADRLPTGEDELAPLARAAGDLRESAFALRLAFQETDPDAVAAFEGVVHPFDRWRLVVRQVSPAGAFHRQFLDLRRSFAGVSASLFVGGDAFAALGELEIEERAGERLQRIAVPSPFNYRDHMRVVALRGGADLVGETADVLARLATALGGRTLGLFTSLRRMSDVADELDARLRREGLDVIAPRRAGDDPSVLVTRFVNGAAVLLGARRFWQGIDIPGDALQAVVIEKLPFEVPDELTRRREERLLANGVQPFQRRSMGKMLLNLKQMVGRLIRGEEDRGIVVIVEGRPERMYFRRLAEALPKGSAVVVATPADLGRLLAEVGIHAPV